MNAAIELIEKGYSKCIIEIMDVHSMLINLILKEKMHNIP